MDSMWTVIGSVLGSGTLASIVTAWMNNKKVTKDDAYNNLLIQVKECTEHHKKCTEELTQASLDRIALRRDNYRLTDKLALIEAEIVTGIVRTDSNGIIIGWNPGAQILF